MNKLLTFVCGLLIGVCYEEHDRRLQATQVQATQVQSNNAAGGITISAGAGQPINNVAGSITMSAGAWTTCEGGK